MALRAVPDHPKFAELQARMGFSRYQAIGALEAIWHFCGRFTPQGNIGKYSDHAIELWVGWNGHPGEFIEALVETGWLDRDFEHRLLVHDWHDHADGATKLALKRKGLPFIRTASEQCRDRVCTESRLPVAGAVPEPVPVPEPVAVSGVQRRSLESKAAATSGPGGPITTATAPASPPQVIPIPSEAENAAAKDLTHSLAKERDAAGVPVGSEPAAIRAAAQVLAGAGDLPAMCAGIRASHAASLPGWAALRATVPAGYVPYLSVWFADGDCLRMPRAPAAAPEAQPPRKRNDPAWVDHLRLVAAGKARLS